MFAAEIPALAKFDLNLRNPAFESPPECACSALTRWNREPLATAAPLVQENLDLNATVSLLLISGSHRN
jgi:hypothetical protein